MRAEGSRISPANNSNSTPAHATLAFIVPIQSLGHLKIAVTLIRFPPIINPLTVHQPYRVYGAEPWVAVEPR